MSGPTPMMRQYLGIKKDYPDAILFFRMGDFYEMFGDDALVASKAMEIALTTRAISTCWDMTMNAARNRRGK